MVCDDMFQRRAFPCLRKDSANENPGKVTKHMAVDVLDTCSYSEAAIDGGIVEESTSQAISLSEQEAGLCLLSK